MLRPLGKACLCNFVLEDGHSIEAGGAEVAAMGHDSELGISPPHAFYGRRERVLRTMRALPGWPDVVLPRGSLLGAAQQRDDRAGARRRFPLCINGGGAQLPLAIQTR
jgi:hypothetical protein